jgi:serine/threonine protein kinase
MDENPQRIGRYGVEAVLGRGAMGVVYRAHDPAIDRVVAIKLIRADLLKGDEQHAFIARFQQEARAAGRCSHPNIVAVYDFALHEGNPFLALEWVDGTDLRTAFADRSLPPGQEVSAIACQILAALSAAHDLGIVHRDIKPANVMLTKSGQVKITDFGISQIQSAGFTQNGMILGTPSYMAPEQWRGGPIDGRSDLFSLGVVLYELLAGTRPFPGQLQTEVMQRILNEEPEDLRQVRPDIPAALASAIMRCLAKRPEARFARAADMMAVLTASMLRPGQSDDDTVVGVGRTLPGPARRDGTAPVDPEIMQSLERRLAQFVGPIAGRLVQSAIRTATDFDDLCATLAAKIDDPTDRNAFQEAVVGAFAPGTAQNGLIAAAPSFSAAELNRVRRELTVFVGPLARVLVKNAAPKASSASGLWRDLATHIRAQSDRSVFLAKAPVEP